MSIRSLFDTKRPINRPIEKVITYQAASDLQLKTEVGEYVATQNITDSFEELLKLMQAAMRGPGHEIGVWVSGFYGSGKSSFTKYFGFALDCQKKVDGDSFLHLLQNQIKSAQVKALFNQVSATYDPEVIFLDLASEMLAEASMADISTVLYRKVLQWAGYSEDIKIADLERMLEKDKKLEAFKKRAAEETGGEPWEQVHNQPLVANAIANRLAHEFYPQYFKTDEDFANLNVNVVKAENERVHEMLDLVFRKSGKKNVFFIIDEVGQYVSAKESLILNLDGLAKNLKQIGGGHAWIFATAQQTLTEDNPSAMLNAPGLFKLKDRFPIQIKLEASDIKEICHTRLLTKSAAGEETLGKMFDGCGPELRTATALKDAGVYEQPLDRRTFINLYPFLPAHFEILLQLLGRLARKTGGLGLRSAIKVVQDVLLDRGGRQGSGTSLADAAVGALANTVTFYDSLRHDIQSSYGHIVDGVNKVATRFPNSKLHLDVAKSVAILQILENLPVTTQNIAALLHSHVQASSSLPDVQKALEEMLKDSFIPLGEKNGSLRFLTQAAVTLQREFDQIAFRNADARAEFNRTLGSLFQPLPSTRLHNARAVTAGVRVAIGGQSFSLDGEKESIQLHVEFTSAATYGQTLKDRENDSRASTNKTTIYLLGRSDPETDKLAATLVRCRKFVDQHKSAPDPETQEFVKIVDERGNRTRRDLETLLRNSLLAGSFVAHGAHRPVAELAQDLTDATRAFLTEAAAKIFDRYSEAPVQADTGLAEKFLKTPLERVPSADDPLQLITRSGGNVQINRNHKALLSIKDWLNQMGQVEGRALLDRFNEPPFGWSKDTTRYLLAALISASELKLRIGGQDRLVRTDDDVLAAFASNRAFGAVGVSLRDDKPDPDALVRAKDRLGELTGETVVPIEDDIAVAAKKHFPKFQQDYSALASELGNLNLPGETRAAELSEDLTEIISGDGSDAVKRLGGVDSPLFETLHWAAQVKKAFQNGLKEAIASLKTIRGAVDQLPTSGIPGTLKVNAMPHLETVADNLAKDAFYNEMPALLFARRELEKLIEKAVKDLASEQTQLLKSTQERLESSPDWIDLNPDDRDWVTTQFKSLVKPAEPTLDGLRQLLAHDYDLSKKLRVIAEEVNNRAAAERDARAKQTGEEPTEETPVEKKDFFLPATIEKTEDIEVLKKQLEGYQDQIAGGKRIRIIPRILPDSTAPRPPTYP